MEVELLEFLMKPESYPHGVTRVQHVETHISHVFLTGEFAYKFKKDVRFDFLDFSTLEKRKYYCERELTLNRRYASELYLSLVVVSKGKSGFYISPLPAPDNAVEFAVKMQQFNSEDLFSTMLEQGRLTEAILHKAISKIAEFHSEAACKPGNWNYEEVQGVFVDNIKELRTFVPDLVEDSTLGLIEKFLREELKRQKPLITSRSAHFVKAVHGDLHLGNICLFQGKTLPFDGIEFNEQLSTCDVIADIAFLIMDLLARGQHALATSSRNRYLELSGDYQGATLLPLYICYRALVRAKVACLKSSQHPEQRDTLLKEINCYLQLAHSYVETKKPWLLSIGGLSGTGKTTLSKLLAKQTGAFHLRSDVLRKHLAGISPEQRGTAEIYKKEMSESTYRELYSLARTLLALGQPVILDAVFQEAPERKAAEQLATDLGVPFYGVWCEVEKAVAKSRLQNRKNDASDADEAVLEQQLKSSLGQVTWMRLDNTPAPEVVIQDLSETTLSSILSENR